MPDACELPFGLCLNYTVKPEYTYPLFVSSDNDRSLGQSATKGTPPGQIAPVWVGEHFEVSSYAVLLAVNRVEELAFFVVEPARSESTFHVGPCHVKFSCRVVGHHEHSMFG